MIKTDETCTSLDTSRVHYVKPPENHIVVDFDIPNEDGNRHWSCYECPQGRGDKLECKCNKIQKGEDCPYFEEWKGE